MLLADRITKKIALTISRAGHSRVLPRSFGADQRLDHPPFPVRDVALVL